MRQGLVGAETDVEGLRRAMMSNPLAPPEALQTVIAKVSEHPEARARIVAAVRRGNARLGRVEQVKRVHLLGRELTVEADEITPTLKVKRRRVEQRFAPVFDRLYAEEGFGLEVGR